MIVNEFLNKIDKDVFSKIMCHYSGISRVEYTEDCVDAIIDRHVKGKAHIFNLFGNKLTVEKEIDTKVSQKEANRIVEELLHEIRSKFDVDGLWTSMFIADLKVEEFLNNKITRERTYFGQSIKIGEKVSKAILKTCSPKVSKEIGILYSMYNQKLSTKGTVVLSIDPCDYITMSSNSSGWHSCHRLNGGEYATGPMSYLADSSTVICYVKSAKDCFIDNGISHTNKSWRQIALVSPKLDFVVQERQYPNINNLNATSVSELFKDLLEKNREGEFLYKEVSSQKLCSLHEDYAEKYEEEPFYYNDTLHGMYQTGYLVYPKSVCLDTLPLPVKGADAFCMICGGSLDSRHHIICDNCE